MSRKRVFIIADAGRSEQALELIKIASNAGADAIKFQLFKDEEVCRFNPEKSDIYAIPRSQHLEIVQACENSGLEFLSAPLDAKSLDYLVDDLGMKKIRVSSGELTNLPLLEGIARKNLPIILSTGMSDLHEVKEAMEVIALNHEGRVDKLSDYLTLLHSTSSFPTFPDDVNLRAMLSLEKEIPVPYGYSDHSQGNMALLMAVAMGASVVEKRISLDATELHALDSLEFEEMVKAVREAEIMLGSDVKKATLDERHVKAQGRRSIILVEEKLSGQRVHQSDIAILRPGTGIAPKFVRSVVGKKLNKNLSPGHILSWEDFQ